MELFKGYIRTKNKKSIEKFKDRTDFSTYEEIKENDEFAGILGDETILIDIDDGEEAELLMNIVEDQQLKCRVYQTTRGKHFLFKNKKIEKNGTHKNLAIAINSDIKIGCRNSYSVLKFNNEERFIEWDIEDDEEYQELPKWLYPIQGSTEFINMERGDGRNQALFNYILTLQSNDFSKDEARECIGLINKFIIKNPLSDSELEVILRDDSFKKPIFFKGNTFLFDKFAMFLKNNHHIKRIDGQLHIYKDGIYVSGYDEIESAMIKHIPHLNRAKRNETLAYLELLLRANENSTDARLLAFRNGLYDIQDEEFIPFSHNHIITNKINWDYNPAAYFSATDDTLDKISCHDNEIRALLEEMVGYCMYRRNELGKAFILVGEGSNGKSTFLNMLKKLIGKKNNSALDLKELSDRFSTVMMFGKLTNIGDDIGDNFITDAAYFKKIVTGETIAVEQKGQPKFDFEPYLKLIFSANNIPRMGKGRDSGAILRRLIIIPFNAVFTKSSMGDDFKPYIGDDLKCQESMEYLIQLGIKGLKRILENREFTNSKQVKKELEDFEENNNPVLAFFKESDTSDIENEATNIVYKQYSTFCSETNINPLSKGEFSKQVKKYYKFTIVDKKLKGKKKRVFVAEE